MSYNLNDVRVGTLPLNGTIYEAEKAKLSNVKAESAADASNGQEVRYINETDSIVDFENIKSITKWKLYYFSKIFQWRDK